MSQFYNYIWKVNSLNISYYVGTTVIPQDTKPSKILSPWEASNPQSNTYVIHKGKFLNHSLPFTKVNLTLIIKTLYHMCSVSLFRVITLDPYSKTRVKLVWFIPVSFPNLISSTWTGHKSLTLYLYASRSKSIYPYELRFVFHVNTF